MLVYLIVSTAKEHNDAFLNIRGAWADYNEAAKTRAKLQMEADRENRGITYLLRESFLETKGVQYVI